MNLKELQAMEDIALARYQAGWKEHTPEYLLCQIEWQRRLHDYGYGLAERISTRERIATLIGAAFGVCATLLAVWVAK